MTCHIKICCIQSQAEAKLAFEAGANSLGLVSEMPDGPGPIPENDIIKIVERAPAGVETVLLTCFTKIDEIFSQHCRVNTKAIQLCAPTTESTRLALKTMLKDVRILQVVHVTGPHAVSEAIQAAIGASAILLDSGGILPGAPQLGGTGLTHDWMISRKIVEISEIPVYLAGGLNPANVAEAIQRVKPFGVDVCSGVRDGVRLNPLKLHTFIGEVRSACQTAL
ncbi:MAG: phosphoribosylanthranilate isomerase [Candidatus Eisenbacteria bacterium]|uniref:N-(5'-phosphoribosyl)anthranilate isomerase n=1 Tax=Eiseniibacteriota bacterium TaxID=2212470 RepID=A0A948RZB6_UNCEI|nr:phosphoribosylanthranilate isomerase [Candidatus Eisenbacteria bacterium]MBU1950847.1 phosphoribosylanthranilate isomerase [Candidatus Eisenbacteria bacterium]MBU2692413.1 phosphoribosylanthranilate isomerase [Candidatus Eisenbacteria bacterium]